MSYRLTYWNKRGRGEQVRLLLEELDLPYENHHVDRQRDMPALKAEGPECLMFGSVPMLEDGDFRLVQGPAILGYLARKHGACPTDLQGAARADAITLGAEDIRIGYFQLFGPDAARKQAAFVDGEFTTRWRPSLEGLLQLNGDSGYFVGDSLSHADVAVWDSLDAILQWVSGATLAGYPRLEQFFQSFKERPRIAAYLASDRRAQG